MEVENLNSTSEGNLVEQDLIFYLKLFSLYNNIYKFKENELIYKIYITVAKYYHGDNLNYILKGVLKVKGSLLNPYKDIILNLT